MKYHSGLFMVLLVVAGQAAAEPGSNKQAPEGKYAIQLEASRSAGVERFQALRAYGSLYTEATATGYIRKRLGPYENRELALEMLKQVHAEGYTDAIITRQNAGDDSLLSQVKKPVTQQYDIDNFDVRSLKEWDLLSAEQQKNLVYLDGKLHVKDGDRFTPLNEIVGTK